MPSSPVDVQTYKGGVYHPNIPWPLQAISFCVFWYMAHSLSLAFQLLSFYKESEFWEFRLSRYYNSDYEICQVI